MYCVTSARIWAGLTCLAAAIRFTWISAFCGEMAGSGLACATMSLVTSGASGGRPSMASARTAVTW